MTIVRAGGPIGYRPLWHASTPERSQRTAYKLPTVRQWVGHARRLIAPHGNQIADTATGVKWIGEPVEFEPVQTVGPWRFDVTSHRVWRGDERLAVPEHAGWLLISVLLGRTELKERELWLTTFNRDLTMAAALRRLNKALASYEAAVVVRDGHLVLVPA